MSDLGPNDGGETVFPKGWPANVAEEDRLDPKTALEEFRASEQGNILERGSWEEDMASSMMNFCIDIFVVAFELTAISFDPRRWQITGHEM